MSQTTFDSVSPHFSNEEIFFGGVQHRLVF